LSKKAGIQQVYNLKGEEAEKADMVVTTNTICNDSDKVTKHDGHAKNQGDLSTAWCSQIEC
jgi:hypothetical protein